jgi:hypothetical protein
MQRKTRKKRGDKRSPGKKKTMNDGRQEGQTD